MHCSEIPNTLQWKEKSTVMRPSLRIRTIASADHISNTIYLFSIVPHRNKLNGSNPVEQPAEDGDSQDRQQQSGRGDRAKGNRQFRKKSGHAAVTSPEQGPQGGLDCLPRCLHHAQPQEPFSFPPVQPIQWRIHGAREKGRHAHAIPPELIPDRP